MSASLISFFPPADIGVGQRYFFPYSLTAEPLGAREKTIIDRSRAAAHTEAAVTRYADRHGDHLDRPTFFPEGAFRGEQDPRRGES